MLILLPMDGAPASLAAVHHVIHLARQGLRVQAVLANVQEAPHLYEVVLAHDAQVLHAASEQAGAHALMAAAALLQAAGIEAAQMVAHGDPGHVLVELVEQQGCEAIAMTGQGPGLLGGSRLGPVALSVLKHAGVPVTIVQPAELAEATDADAADPPLSL